MFLFQWFDRLNLYQEVENENFPNHDIQPSNPYFDDNHLPVEIGFPVNPNGEMFAKWNYDDLDSVENILTMNIQAAVPRYSQCNLLGAK